MRAGLEEGPEALREAGCVGCREHVDSFSDLPPEAAADFGRVAARVERDILGPGRHRARAPPQMRDGAAHFHVWFIPRPLGMVEASGMMLPLWDEALPNVSDEELREAAERVAARMDGSAD